MAAWTSEELNKIAVADELELASARRDGTLRKPVTIWVVRHGDDLYVRSWRGLTSRSVRKREQRRSGWCRGDLEGRRIRAQEPIAVAATAHPAANSPAR